MTKYIVMCCRNGQFDQPSVRDTYEQAFQDMKYEYELVLDRQQNSINLYHEIMEIDEYTLGEAFVEVGTEIQVYWGISTIEV